ncbi:MAG: DUF1559 domain-containing protein [Planctomycetaceae bacterium]|nr:DUF1559 domain-containing protein [Planctomycetaceae bacterium]
MSQLDDPFADDVDDSPAQSDAEPGWEDVWESSDSFDFGDEPQMGGQLPPPVTSRTLRAAKAARTARHTANVEPSESNVDRIRRRIFLGLRGIVFVVVAAGVFLIVRRAIEVSGVAHRDDPGHSLRVAESLENIGRAWHEYEQLIGTFPVGPPEATRTPDAYGPDGRPLLSWRVAILPLLGEEKLFRRFRLNEPWDSRHNKALLDQMPSVYQTDPALDAGYTTLLAVAGNGTLTENGLGTSARDCTDGLSNTIAVICVDSTHAVPWTQPVDWQFTSERPFEGLDLDRQSIDVLCADGRVHQLEKPDAAAMRGFCLRNDGRNVNGF